MGTGSRSSDEISQAQGAVTPVQVCCTLNESDLAATKGADRAKLPTEEGGGGLARPPKPPEGGTMSAGVREYATDLQFRYNEH